MGVMPRAGASLDCLILALVPLASGCLQSVHRDGPSGLPILGWPVRILEERAGRGQPIRGGDRVRVDLTGQYASGEVWGQGPLTFIAGSGSYPGAMYPLRVGATIRMQYLTNPNDTTARLWPFPGLDTENEAYLVRRDRGPIIVEHTIRSVCRPYKLFLLQTGFGPIEMGLGCWPVLRFAGRRADPARAQFERRVAAINSGDSAPPPDGVISDPPAAPRAPADTAWYLGPDGLHRAALEGRPEIAGWLIRQGRNVSAADSFGFRPIHYVGWAQRPLERFVPAFEQDYLAVLDTLLAHGASVDAQVGAGRPRAPTLPEREYEGRTALEFAASECAERLVRRLLERGASAMPHSAPYGTVALAGAAMQGCPETVRMLLAAGAPVDSDPGGGTPLQRLCAVSVFYQGQHYEAARLLVEAGAATTVAAERLAARLKDPGPGGFGFSNRREARRILKLLRSELR
jgi:hypothetical protein